jgi:chaperonin GroEL
MVHEGLRNVAAGANPTSLGRGIAAAADAVASALAAKATPVTDEQAIAQVATVSSRDPKIGALVGEGMTKVGEDGVITVEEASTMAIELEITEGVAFDKGYISPYFVTDAERMETVLTDPYVLLHREKISSIPELLPLLELVSQEGKPLLIVAEDVEGEALSTLAVNALRKTLSVVAVKSPFFGDRRRAFMDDLAAITGAKVVDPEVGLKLSEVGLEVLGGARRIVVTRDDTTIVEGAGDRDEVEARAAQIRHEIEESDSDWDRERLQERLAKLVGGVAVIKVGAATETELKERKGRIEDAVAAARAAAEEGIVPGGGAALLHAANSIGDLGLAGDEATGAAIVRRACAAPVHWISANAGFEGSVVAAKVREAQWGHGFDAEAETYRDLVAAGIIDPVKVTRSAIVNAASIARMVLTTESAVVEKPEKAPPAGQAHGHGHGHSHGM